VLRDLGVLKVATADQIQRLTLPHPTYRHTAKPTPAKPTPAKQKEARTASRRAAASRWTARSSTSPAGRRARPPPPVALGRRS
jgi:hypothetical protein